MTHSQLLKFIKDHSLAVLSTVNAADQPQSALVGIAVTPTFEFIFDTLKTSRKYENLTRNSAVALVVGCEGEQTLQYEGHAFELPAHDLAPYQALYFAAHPDGPNRQSWPDICYFVVKPNWIRFSDYAQTPPLIEEFRFS